MNEREREEKIKEIDNVINEFEHRITVLETELKQIKNLQYTTICAIITQLVILLFNGVIK